MDAESKLGRYTRVQAQLEGLFVDVVDPLARMATIVALLHAKMPGYFWTGFYVLRDGELLVGPYQGSLACLRLKPHTGVCWAGIDRAETIIVPDVHAFPGHIACDSRSCSEIAVPVRDQRGAIVAVFDVDSDRLATFDEVDRRGLEPIVALIYG